MMQSAPLLDPTFVRTLELLRRRLSIRARSGSPGERLAKRRGGSAEFEEHRAYSPGDDVRRIDWAAYARSDEPVLKTFRLEEDAVVRLVCDASLSMDFGSPSKLDTAKRLLAAVGYMALAGSERAELVVASSGSALTRGATRGRGALAGLLRALDELKPSGTTDLARSIDAVINRAKRPGMLVVASDFLDRGPHLDALGRAASQGHDVVIAQVLAEEDRRPLVEGDVALEDAETGEIVEVTLDRTLLAAVHARFVAHCEALASLARRRRAAYVLVVAGQNLEEPLRRIVSQSIDSAEVIDGARRG